MKMNLMKRVMLSALCSALAIGIEGPDRLIQNAVAASEPKDTIHSALEQATQVAAGGFHTCALTSAGGVKCWGENAAGQLGDNTNLDTSSPVDVVGLSSGVSSITAGYDRTCALTVAGGVKCWGGYKNSMPMDVPGLTSGVSSIAAGFWHVCAVTSSGNAKCWGWNNYGQLGDGTTTETSIPVDVIGLSNDISTIAVGFGHTCALTQNGVVKCWGGNWAGQLGDATLVQKSAPATVLGLTNGVRAISTRDNHTCALLVDNTVKCWGYNDSGQLGDGTTVNQSVPVKVAGLTGDIGAILTGGSHSCALMTTGGVKCWGANWAAQLGDGTTVNRGLPVEVFGLSNQVNRITLGNRHSCALLTAGDLKCWGSNDVGQLGNGTAGNKNSPIDVSGLNNDVLSIATGSEHTCARIGNNGLKCWGANYFGGLGDGTKASTSTPVDVALLSSGVVAVSAGYTHTCAITTLGGVKCWGRNANGELGIGTKETKTTLVDVLGLTSGVNSLSAGGYSTCVLIAGGVKCWGSNWAGQLGDGTFVDKSTPVDVQGLNDQVVAVSVSGHYDGNHSCALTFAGAVKCWGANEFGQLGDGTNVTNTLPVNVVGLNSGVTAISTGGSSSCALLADGSVVCWGYNAYGQLGNNTTLNTSVPVRVLGLASKVSAISMGGNHTCALTSAGSMKCWGYNADGELGMGGNLNSSTPVGVVGLSDKITAISVGGNSTCALISSKMKCWGSNIIGQLGDGTAWRTTPQDVIGFSTPPPAPIGDIYETDDTCGQATFLTANTVTQTHTFDKQGDADWIRVELVTGTNYSLVASHLAGGAAPSFTLRPSCVTPPIATSPPTFGSEVSLPMKAGDYPPGTYYIRITNTPTTTFGDTTSYQLSFRATGSIGAVILVAGQNGGSIHQQVITQTTDLAYDVLRRNGFSKDRIYYLDAQTLRDVDGNGLADDIDAAATVSNLQFAITSWARDKVGPAQPLWLMMADHGFPKQFLVSGDGANDLVTPTLLKSWLNQLEADTGVDQVNVILDACYSGSFITQPDSISKPGRVIITSVDDKNVATGRLPGPNVIQRMSFSETFWGALDANLPLNDAFIQAKNAASRATYGAQVAWLDDNGDGYPNTITDGAQSSARGLIGSVTFGGRPYLTWQSAVPNTGALSVNAPGARTVLVEISRPDVTQAQIPGQVNLTQHDLVTMTLSTANQWVGRYPNFNVPGVYQAVAYAWAGDGGPALPTEIRIIIGLNNRMFLPVLRR